MRARLRRASRPGEPADAGNVTVFVVGLAMVLALLAGLVVDGGNRINAEMTMEDDAEQAARAGATAIDQDALRENGVVQLAVGPTGAAATAEAYMRKLGYGSGGGQVQASLVDAQTVRVDATMQQSTQLLSIIRIDTFTITAHAQASAVTGINGPGR